MPLLGSNTPDPPRSRQALWGTVSQAGGGEAALEGGRSGVMPGGVSMAVVSAHRESNS